MKSNIDKKGWSVRTVDQKNNVWFYPFFESVHQDQSIATLADREIECRYVDIVIDGKNYRFNFLDLFMFVYYCANEELRQQLALRHERKVNYIPYDVTFKISKEEKERGSARRRIELPVDEIAMAVARNESMKYMQKFLRPKK